MLSPRQTQPPPPPDFLLRSTVVLPSSTAMQKYTWLLVFLPYLHWFGSLVHGAAVSNSPPRLNNTDDPWNFITIVPKQRGAVLSAIRLSEACIEAIALDLGRDNYAGFMVEKMWSHITILLSVSLREGMPDQVQQAFVIV